MAALSLLSSFATDSMLLRPNQIAATPPWQCRPSRDNHREARIRETDVISEPREPQ